MKEGEWDSERFERAIAKGKCEVGGGGTTKGYHPREENTRGVGVRRNGCVSVRLSLSVCVREGRKRSREQSLSLLGVPFRRNQGKRRRKGEGGGGEEKLLRGRERLCGLQTTAKTKGVAKERDALRVVSSFVPSLYPSALCLSPSLSLFVCVCSPACMVCPCHLHEPLLPSIHLFRCESLLFFSG